MLSQRQREVLALIADGKCKKEVASHLGLCLGTVKAHCQMAALKLNARTTPQAVANAIRAGLI